MDDPVPHGVHCWEEGPPIEVGAYPPRGLAGGRLCIRFGIGRVAMVSDKGVITTVRIRPDLEPADPDWNTAPGNAEIRRLLRPSAGVAWNM